MLVNLTVDVTFLSWWPLSCVFMNTWRWQRVKEHCNCQVGLTAPTTTPNLNGFTQCKLISCSCHGLVIVNRTLSSDSLYLKPWRTPNSTPPGRVSRVKQEGFFFFFSGQAWRCASHFYLMELAKFNASATPNSERGRSVWPSGMPRRKRQIAGDYHHGRCDYMRKQGRVPLYPAKQFTRTFALGPLRGLKKTQEGQLSLKKKMQRILSVRERGTR